MDLPLLSAFFTVFALTVYTLLDGFDLGVGALLLLQPDEKLRDRMIDSILPTWDGNETWLIMAGVALLAAFPIAYGLLLPAFYLPLIAMLLALGLRGVSFEFRYQTSQGRGLWDIAFSVGSIIAALMQGLIVGGLVQGVAVDGTAFSGNVFDVFRPFAVLTALSVLMGYLVLGSGWLHLKGSASLQEFVARTLRVSVVAFVVLAVAVCATAPCVQPALVTAWHQHAIALGCLSATFLFAGIGLFRAVDGALALVPFALGLTMFSVALVGLVTAVYPDIVPFRLSIWQAASATRSHVFLLTGAAIVTPVVLGYSAFAYRVFRGRTPEEGWES